MVSQKGEFEPFKMLIGAIFALLILTIIVSAIKSFEDFRIKVSTQKFYAGLKNAVEQPNGDQLVIENILFEKGQVFSQSSVAKNIGLEHNCLEFKQNLSNPYFVFIGSDSIKINAKMDTTVFVQCYTNTQSGNVSPSCEISCKVSFGEPI